MLLAGTLELASKVRYGLTGRGVPLFRFIPYDKRFAPLAVGCSARNLFYNVHALVEPSTTDPKRGSLVKNLGPPTPDTEQQVLLTSYAYDSRKQPKSLPPPPLSFQDTHRRTFTTAFHIDPPGCRDVDDAFSITPIPNTNDSYEVAIHIADVSAWILPDSDLDKLACFRATTFYSSDGEALVPMFPPDFSEGLGSLLPGTPRPTLTLSFTWTKNKEPENFQWFQSLTTTTTSYTYEHAQFAGTSDIQRLRDIAVSLGADPMDSHTWVAALMILYNTKAGQLLKSKEQGLLRRHAGPSQEKAAALALLLKDYPALLPLTQEAAEYCFATDKQTTHVGLGQGAYAYASSPLRRYADLVNQRFLKFILFKHSPATPLTQTLIDELNRREKQAKAFQRDWFFLTELQQQQGKSVLGLVVHIQPTSFLTYVQAWKRFIKVKTLTDSPPVPGKQVSLQWWTDPTQARWKERMVFKLATPGDESS